MDNNAKILRHFVAEAVAISATMTADYGNGPEVEPIEAFNAQFGFPGGQVDFVYEGDQPKVYGSEFAAETDARRVLVESLNARYSFRTKREFSSKMTGDEFAADLGELDIMPGDFAQMWGTKQGKVMDWITGAAEVPFALRWILKLLRRPGAIEEAQKIAAENLTYKPAWLERQRSRTENQEGV